MNTKKFPQMITILLLFFVSFPIIVNADTGPKDSIYITFENMRDELCYGTLLSKHKAVGPARTWDGQKEHAQHNENEYYSDSPFNYAIWQAFVEYQDIDGYYFLQKGWQINETKEIAWTYYPPSSFKILLYYPERNVFAVSDIYEKYAFDTYYTVNMDDVTFDSMKYDESQSTDGQINAYRSYNYTQEILSLIARIVITIVLEIAAALLFRFRKKTLLVIAVVNIVTQIILNVLLNIINFNSGPLAFIIFYILFEIIVFALEAILYCTILKKVSEHPKKNWYYVLYALVANTISFGAGLLIAQILPGIF